MFYIYIDITPKADTAPLYYHSNDIISIYLSSVILSFIGAFISELSIKEKE